MADNRVLVFYHNSMARTAEQLKVIMGDKVVLANLEWKRFNDGFPNLAIDRDNIQAMESCTRTVALVSFHDPSVIFDQLCLVYALPRMQARDFTIILPWFCTGTMDRSETLGTIVTAASLARMLSATPMGRGGPATVVIYDIHALQEQFFFSDQIICNLKTAVVLLKDRLAKVQLEFPDEELAIAFPDDGAHKRFHRKITEMFGDIMMIVCNKVRDGEKRAVVMKEGDPKGKHVIIVDDLVQSGGTLLEAFKGLNEAGARKVSCFVTHGVFPLQSYEKFLHVPNIYRFWITDTIPTSVQAVEGKSPFEVLSIAPLIARFLLGAGDE
eukprot:NODE_13502_length_1161_cov_10.115087.p1 GENE.NODE_13502_length_1161_cov_10.115087~~NODE_13502_length_1161_cov_10.115087.p1  ORF type:complete len:326 (-),score=80.88 NODE_13502_length_1161_cov_10.115087:76-1053(-)